MVAFSRKLVSWFLPGASLISAIISIVVAAPYVAHGESCEGPPMRCWQDLSVTCSITPNSNLLVNESATLNAAVTTGGSYAPFIYQWKTGATVIATSGALPAGATYNYDHQFANGGNYSLEVRATGQPIVILSGPSAGTWPSQGACTISVNVTAPPLEATCSVTSNKDAAEQRQVSDHEIIITPDIPPSTSCVTVSIRTVNRNTPPDSRDPNGWFIEWFPTAFSMTGANDPPKNNVNFRSCGRWNMEPGEYLVHAKLSESGTQSITCPPNNGDMLIHVRCKTDLHCGTGKTCDIAAGQEFGVCVAECTLNDFRKSLGACVEPGERPVTWTKINNCKLTTLVLPLKANCESCKDADYDCNPYQCNADKTKQVRTCTLKSARRGECFVVGPPPPALEQGIIGCVDNDYDRHEGPCIGGKQTVQYALKPSSCCINNKPASASVDCKVPCDEDDFACTEWSPCPPSGGVQIRSCPAKPNTFCDGKYKPEVIWRCMVLPTQIPPTLKAGGGVRIYEIATSALQTFVNLLIPLIVLFFVITGLMFITSRGNPEKLRVAKKALLYVSIGAGVVLGSWALAKMIEATFKAAGG